jgi:hypothetical protein
MILSADADTLDSPAEPGARLHPLKGVPHMLAWIDWLGDFADAMWNTLSDDWLDRAHSAPRRFRTGHRK